MTTTPQAQVSEEMLAEIEARANAATAAPWLSRPTVTGMQRVLAWLDENAWRGSIEFVLATVNSWSAPGYGPLKAEADANADFIAHARTDIPVLVAEIRRLQSALSVPPARDDVAALVEAAIEECARWCDIKRDEYEARSDNWATFNYAANQIRLCKERLAAQSLARVREEG